MTASAPSPARPPRGWAPEVWALRVALLRARERLPYASAEARLLDGVERFVRLTGRGAAAAGPGWANLLAMVTATARLCGPETRAILAPWTGLVLADAVAGAGFRPVGAP